VTLPSQANSKNAIHVKYLVGGITLPSMAILIQRMQYTENIWWEASEVYSIALTWEGVSRNCI